MTNQAQQHLTPAWVADQGDGTFRNPVLHADYSDPDVIRVGEDFYMTASSFGHLPGLPILHSKDLVNWRLINHAIHTMPLEGYERPQHGKGVWAPAIRHHDGKFWIYYGDPDVGIFMTQADDPAGEWSPLHLVKAGKGLIDTCPLWDEDGQAYLVHAYAHSRSGIKHKLNLCRMTPDGKQLLDEGQIVFDGTESHPTMEGPKMYKRNGWYYIFAPAGGVATGWQTVLRSQSIYGPYEDRIVMHQGESDVNGPHQGGWVELESGESWFMHFQDKDAYGRIVHLQPVTWIDDWPIIGRASDGNAEIGEPVELWTKPDVGKEWPIEIPETTDEFDAPDLGLQWQWQGNPQADWYSLQERPGHLRLFAAPALDGPELYGASQLLMQKFPARAFVAETSLELAQLRHEGQAGMIVFGLSYLYLAVRAAEEGQAGPLVLVQGNEEQERELWSITCQGNAVTIRLVVEEGAAKCSFAYSWDGETFHAVEAPLFQAEPGKWVGAKCGLFALTLSGQETAGYVDASYFRIGTV